MKNIIKGIIAVAIVFGIIGVSRLLSRETFTDNTPVMPAPAQNLFTKDGYLQAIRANHDGSSGFTLSETECVYNLLIDTYGVTETRNIDIKALKQSSEIDQRMLWAVERCI
jgi:hypothetical protein